MLTGSVDAIKAIAAGSAQLATGSGPKLGESLQKVLNALTSASGGTPTK